MVPRSSELWSCEGVLSSLCKGGVGADISLEMQFQSRLGSVWIINTIEANRVKYVDFFLEFNTSKYKYK